MRKNVFGRRFKRDKNERKALFKGLITSLVLYGRIETTEEKAKSIKGEIDKIVNNAKKDVLTAKKLLSFYLSPKAMEKMISNVAPHFSKRQSGFTRIIKTGRRVSDSAAMAIMEWVEPIENQISNIKNQKLETEESEEKLLSDKIETKKENSKKEKEPKKPSRNKRVKREVKK